MATVASRLTPLVLCGSKTCTISRSFSNFISTPFVFSSLRLSAGVAPLRKSRVAARSTALREEEKVVVEESFTAKSFPDKEGKTSSEDAPGSAPSALERWVIKLEQSVSLFLTESIVKVLDRLYGDRYYARFFVLETIARVPYFAFISVLHLYESFGWWRKADYLKVHFAESWNEMHHLLIMEELGGSAFWFDRLIARHIAFFYYWMTVVMYALSPRLAYHFSECVERHAYMSYDKFVKLKEEELKQLPPPVAALEYYMNEDLYLFDEFQTDRPPQSRRPKIENLYDVFVNIRDDEFEHYKTMKACQTDGLLSPHSNPKFEVEDAGCTFIHDDCQGIVDPVNETT